MVQQRVNALPLPTGTTACSRESHTDLASISIYDYKSQAGTHDWTVICPCMSRSHCLMFQFNLVVVVVVATVMGGVSHHVCRGQRTTFRDWFSPSTLSRQLLSCLYCSEYSRLNGLQLPGDSPSLLPSHRKRANTAEERDHVQSHAVLETELKLSGLHGKCFCPLSHLDNPPLSSLFKQLCIRSSKLVLLG